MATKADVVTKVDLHHSWKTGQDEVMCLFVSREQSILTGHEESMLLIWSIDVESKNTSLRESISLPLKGSVTCVSQFPHTNALALSVDRSILIYDYVIVDNVIATLSLKDQFCFNQEEINQIDIHPKGSFLCSCDDSGEVKVIDLDNKKILHTLTQFHDSICSTVKFSSKKPWELVSGGLDCTIGRWDFNRGRLLANVSTKDSASSDIFLVNPPMVHSLDMLCAHNSIACGLGDGRLVIYSLKSPKGIDLVCQTHPHLNSIACVRCIDVKDATNSTTTIVVSVGNDRVMCVHKLVHKEGQSKCTAPLDLTLIGKICYISKVNWVEILCIDTIFIFTADVSGSVSVYNFKY